MLSDADRRIAAACAMKYPPGKGVRYFSNRGPGWLNDHVEEARRHPKQLAFG